MEKGGGKIRKTGKGGKREKEKGIEKGTGKTEIEEKGETRKKW